MEDIIGGCCFGDREATPPHSIQARALVCWVSRFFLPGLPPTSSDASSAIPTIRRLCFPLTVPRQRMRPPVPFLSFLRFLHLFFSVLHNLCTVNKKRKKKGSTSHRRRAGEGISNPVPRQRRAPYASQFASSLVVCGSKGAPQQKRVHFLNRSAAGRRRKAQKPTGLDLAGLRHRAPPSV